MCGLAGILRIHAPGSVPPPLLSIPESWLDILDDSIKHRGPDGHGRFRDRAVRPDGTIVDVALVHRRLSILDHAGGHQPMVSLGKGRGVVTAKRANGPTWLLYETPDDPVIQAWNEAVASVAAPAHSPADSLIAVAFNGCIYNHRELRRQLQAAGHVFSSDHSDTEVLVHGWREWGPELKTRLEGMYAIAIWDAREGQLVCMRDRFGEKPLYVSATKDPLSAFASTPAGLARLSARERGTPPPLHDGSVRAWVQYGWNQAGPFDSIASLPIDATAAIGIGARQLEPLPSIWHEVLNVDRHPLGVDEVDTALREATTSRLEADVPLGCFLSGGIDSALIAAYAREHRPDISAYTVEMPAPEMNESDAAQATARHLGIRHTILHCDAQPTHDLVQLIHQLGLPFGDSSLLPATWVSRAARQHSVVALAGDGGDELFMGYDRHRALPLLSSLERMGPAHLAALVEILPKGRHGSSRWSRLNRLIAAATYTGYKELLAIFPTPDTWNLGLAPQDALGWNHIPHFGMTPHADRRDDDALWLDTVRQFDLASYLPEDLLRKTDTSSMSCALEVRAPFLDTTLSRLALQAELSSLMPGGQRKGLLKQVARKYLPDDIVNRPKQGFAIPIGHWFRSDFGGLRQLLLDHLLGPEPFGPDSLGINATINMDCVRQMLKEHDDAGTASLWPWKGRDHSQRLYMLLVLSIWAKWLGKL